MELRRDEKCTKGMSGGKPASSALFALHRLPHVQPSSAMPGDIMLDVSEPEGVDVGKAPQSLGVDERLELSVDRCH